MKARAFTSFGIVTAALVVACLGEDVQSNPNDDSGGCGEGQKLCGGHCVTRDDPAQGCFDAQSCEPCPSAPNASATCKDGACATACNEGFDDCDVDPKNGCEVRTATDAANCGACGNACGSANTEVPSKCEGGKCTFACKPGFAHCRGDDAFGCETNVLEDGEHCGSCGHSCLGGTCKEGKCQPFQLTALAHPSGVAVDATHVYVTFPSLTKIQRVNKDGKCTPATPCPQDFAGAPLGDPLAQIRGPSAIVSDGTHVFWSNQPNSSIGRRAVGGGDIVNWGPAASTEPGYIVLAGGKLFWTQGFAGAGDIHVQRSNLDGTGIEVVARYAPPASTFQGHGGITADATHVYWASESSGVFRAKFDDPTCNEEFGVNAPCGRFSASGAYGVAVDDTYVYWTEPEAGDVKRALKTGGSSTAVATGQAAPHGIAVLDGVVYWANKGGDGDPGSVRRNANSGTTCAGTACELVMEVPAPDAIVAAPEGIYFTSGVEQGGVYRLAK